MQNFRDLKVWQRAHEFALVAYKATAQFPKEELYGITNQLRRSSVSIPTNIAEGCGRNSNAELARFLQIAMGSAAEAEYQLLLCRDLNYLSETQYTRLSNEIVEIRRMLNVLIQRVSISKRASTTNN